MNKTQKGASCPVLDMDVVDGESGSSQLGRHQ